MGNRGFTRIHLLLVTVVAAAASFVAPAGASAAMVVNGDFETGTLSGWQVFNVPSEPESTGNWYAYSGTAAPSPSELPISAPPSGVYGAITAQGGEGTHILYQDVALEPYYGHQLSLFAYYHSAAPLVTPSPNTLSSEVPAPNQQYRIDVMKPTAALTSLEPSDILATVFATKTGDPEELAPTKLTVDLTPFAGQTVRLRFAEVDNQFYFAAAADAVAIASTPPSNAFTLGKPVLNRKKGTAQLPVTVPGAGTLKISDVKKTKRRVKTKTVQASAAGTLNLPVKPTKLGRKILAAKGKLKVKVAVTFTPTGGFAATQTKKLTLRLAP